MVQSTAAVVRIPAPSGYARQAVDTALGACPLVVLTPRLVAQLEHECGGPEKLAAWVLKLVTRRRRPLAFHDPEQGRTWCWSPPDWTPERLQGYLAAHHTELEATLGPIARIWTGGDRDA
jgi:hypothetical protein